MHVGCFLLRCAYMLLIGVLEVALTRMQRDQDSLLALELECLVRTMGSGRRV